jgi:ubiquinone/menaquinone biosynthesis C-methylase UbiE
MDIRDLSIIPDDSFDVVYANSLMYLFPQEVKDTLKGMRRVVKGAVYLCNPFKGETDDFNDPYRKFLATKKWWAKQFNEAGCVKLSECVYSNH